MKNNIDSSIDLIEYDLKIWFYVNKIHFPSEIQNSINKYKKLYKQELKEFFEAGKIHGIDIITDINNGDDVNSLSFEPYYNEKFEGNNEQQ